MTTTADYKAMITTEIRVPLAQIPDEDIGKIIGNNGCNLKIIEDNSNTHCSWDQKNLSLYIHGEPKAAKQAYTIVMAQISKLASANGTTAPEAMVNILGKEYVDGVRFCKLTDATVASDEDTQDDTHSKSKKVKPTVFVVHPTTMTYEEKQRGRGMANELWRRAQFVTWDFRNNVIQDASMALRRQLYQLPQGEGNYLKLEMNIGKVIFLENDRIRFSLQGAKFTISEFRHLRFNKEITSSFRKDWKGSWVTRLRGMLPMLGYEKDGCTVKHVKIYHTTQHEDKRYEIIWTTDILEGKRLGGAKPGTLEFVKARVRGDNPFSLTVYGPATAFDFRFSIITNTHESVEHNRELETRVRRAYRYSLNRGLLVNHPYENYNGYTPLVNPKARLIHETAWKRGDIKVIINEIQDENDSTFEVKIQSNLLKKYTREEPGEVPLSDMVEAVRDLLEAAEEINGELNVLTTELPSREMPMLDAVTGHDIDSINLPPPRATQPNYGTLGASIHNVHGIPGSDKALVPNIRVPHNFMFETASAARGCKPASQLSSENSEDNRSEELLLNLGSAFKKTSFGAQPKKELISFAWPQSPIIGTVGKEAFWEGGSVTAKKANRNTTHGKQVPIEGLTDSLPPHLRPVAKSLRPKARTITIHRSFPSPGNSSSVKQLSPSYNNFSDSFFDLLDPATDCSGPYLGVLTPRKVVSPRSGKMIDFFGSAESLEEGDSEDLMSWSPDIDEFAYVHESDPVGMELEEGVSLLLD